MRQTVGLLRRSQRGVTLVEMAIVLAIIGILAAVAVPNLSGFLSSSAQASYDGDKATLQTASDAFRADAGNVGGKYPTLGALSAATTDDCFNDNGTFTSASDTLGATCQAYIDIGALVNGSGTVSGGFLSSTTSVKSADTDNNTTATNPVSGTYSWFIDKNGRVDSDPTFEGAGSIYP